MFNCLHARFNPLLTALLVIDVPCSENTYPLISCGRLLIKFLTRLKVLWSILISLSDVCVLVPGIWTWLFGKLKWSRFIFCISVNLVPECGVGLVKIGYTEDKTYFSLPEPKISDIELKQLEGIIESLGINGEDVIHSKKVNIGAEWLTLHIKNSSIVKRIEPNFEQMKDYIYEGTTGVTIFGENEDVKDTTFEVRSFAPNEGVNKDPVCGSGNGCVAALNELYGLVENKEYSNSQGECINRNGRVYIKREDGLKLGGISKIVIDGKIRIEN